MEVTVHKQTDEFKADGLETLDLRVFERAYLMKLICGLEDRARHGQRLGHGLKCRVESMAYDGSIRPGS